MEQWHDAEQWEYGALSDMILKSDDAIVLADAQGVVLLANAGACDVVGIPAEAMTGLLVQEFGRESMHAFQSAAVSAVIANSVEIPVREARRPPPNGGSTPVDLTMPPPPPARGPMVAIGIREPN